MVGELAPLKVFLATLGHIPPCPAKEVKENTPHLTGVGHTKALLKEVTRFYWVGLDLWGGD